MLQPNDCTILSNLDLSNLDSKRGRVKYFTIRLFHVSQQLGRILRSSATRSFRWRWNSTHPWFAVPGLLFLSGDHTNTGSSRSNYRATENQIEGR